MKNRVKILIIIAAGALLAAISNYFITGWYNIIPWAIAALLVGWLSETRRKSILNGAVFGYVLFLVYIWQGYSGKTDAGSMLKFVAFDAGFSLVGAVAGVVGAVVGSWIKGKIGKR
jgi:hypothetical protein